MTRATESPYDALLTAFDDLVARVTYLEERIACVEGAWQRHGLEMARAKEQLSHLHCGCGERLTSEDDIKRAWSGDLRPAYSLDED